MIHVDVCKKTLKDQHVGYKVQVRRDGAGWKTVSIHEFNYGLDDEAVLREAQWTARMFAEGCYYASGAITRKTCLGYNL